MTTSPERGSLGEPGEISFVTSSDFEHVVALLDPDALSKTIAVLTGISGIGRLKLNRTDFGSRPATRVSRCLVKMLIEEPDAADLLSPLVIEELEHAILVAFVSGNRHNYSHLLDRQVADAAPWQIRRVEEYIEANWDQPLTIEAMAVIANASARSIFSSFRAHCGYTPMHFVKKLRLEHAREMLASGDSEMTVTNAAFACGFGNLGHFAHDYQRMLGELPSATLRRARNVPNRQPRRGALSFTPDCSQVLPPSNNDPVVVGWPKSSNIGIDRFR
jgi:AraC-like DNA-binding protein